MKLRSRSTRNKGQGTHAKPTTQDDTDIIQLPLELIYILTDRFLSIEDVAAASQASTAFAKHFRAGICRATLVVGGQDGQQPLDAVRALAKHSSISELQVLLSSRSDYGHVGSVLSRLTMLKQLERLHLCFMVTPTPKKGGWPTFFADEMAASKLKSLTVEGPRMPSVALMNLLLCLNGSLNSPAASKLSQLVFRLGQLPSGSQLPAFSSPSWLLSDFPPRVSALDGDHLKQLVSIKSLNSLCFELDPSVLPSDFQRLSALTRLSRLVLCGTHLRPSIVKQMHVLTSVRHLSYSMAAEAPANLGPLNDWTNMQELNLCLVQGPTPRVVEHLTLRPPSGLKGLCLDGAAIGQEQIRQLAQLTALTSLRMVRADLGGVVTLDLTPLSRLTDLRQFTLQASTCSELMQLKFSAAPPPSKPNRRLTGACQSVGKRQKRNSQPPKQPEPEDTTVWGDASAMLGAWPHLQQLQLAGLGPYAVCHTQWEGLQHLTCLTSLALQFTPSATGAVAIMWLVMDVKQTRLSERNKLPVVRLEWLPQQLAELQLMQCYVCVPAEGSLPCGVSLTSLSLCKCEMACNQKSADTSEGGPVILHEQPGPSPAQQPFLQLLQHTEQLHHLELINLAWLDDELLTRAAALMHLRNLGSLSVIAVGNQAVTHGGLLGLTRLSKLRQLRWHVGDALELMPDTAALGQLRGLVSLHLPTWLHSQMERWGAYAVLDQLHMCDVHVEVPV